MRSLSILGSTGSIGCNTLNVVRLHPDKFNIFALSSYTNTDLLLDQAIEFRPSVIVTKDEISAKKIYELIKNTYIPEILYGISGYRAIASADEATDIVAAISGSAGLIPTMDAITHGKRILLANKEAMVMAGPLMIDLCSKFNAKLIPVDSEHNAIFQIIHTNSDNNAINKIILTASGGPFRDFSKDQLLNVTVEEALNHPNWVMGKKITIDSATMMNKGLEVIEAAYLFDIPIAKIDVLIHPQSIIHSFVEFHDGSLISQLGYPDMRIPISYALGFPDRIKSGIEGIRLEEAKDLTFERPDNNLFPCLDLAYQAFSLGMASTIILNAVNEVAVEAFLKKIIPFTEIPNLIDSALQSWAPRNPSSIEDILDIDSEIRTKAMSLISKS
ncbi:MAG: 1-deoxy-D-xylulose-5-phosphate reductoisomerase [Methylophilaceae bacterium]|nr:1-deoxy-D-xylulose-5-phosphate reductoisomerase [Methylophilaceae bacterium]